MGYFYQDALVFYGGRALPAGWSDKERFTHPWLRFPLVNCRSRLARRVHHWPRVSAITSVLLLHTLRTRLRR